MDLKKTVTAQFLWWTEVKIHNMESSGILFNMYWDTIVNMIFQQDKMYLLIVY